MNKKIGNFKLIKNVLNEASNCTYIIILLALLNLVTIGVSIGMIWFSKEFIDAVIQGNYNRFIKIIIFGAVLYILSIIISFINRLFYLKFYTNSCMNLRCKLFQKIFNSNVERLSEYSLGELETRVNRDSEDFITGISDTILNIITNICLAICSFIFLLSLNIKLTLIIFIVIPFAFVSSKYFSNKARKYWGKSYETYCISLSKTREMLDNVIISKAYCSENKVLNKVYNKWSDFVNYQLKGEYTNRVNVLILTLIKSYSKAIILVVGGLYLINGLLSVGTLIAFLQLSEKVINPLIKLLSVSMDISRVQVVAERINEILELEGEEGQYYVTSNEKASKNSYIEFCNVSYGYNKNKNVLKKLSFKINKGEKVAILGPSGIGKSTLFKLLVKLCEVNEGNIYIEGKELKSYNINDLREKFSLVNQSNSILPLSLIENIAFNDNSNMEYINYLIDNLELNKVYHQFKNNNYKIIEQDGEFLSGGEKQKIQLARAIFKKSSIVLLDEAMSSLDLKTERKIIDFINAECKDRTILMITHRIETAKYMDRILVINDGKIVEDGTHEELIRYKDYYYNMCNIS